MGAICYSWPSQEARDEARRLGGVLKKVGLADRLGQ